MVQQMVLMLIIRVAYDEETDEFVITNKIGREINISATTESKLHEAFLRTSAGVGAAQTHCSNDVNVLHPVVLTEASSVKLTFNQDM